ncbi:MAG: MCE family protein [Synergistetes bacterium]|nr:MCE family protein [Synergistota bacterium]
MREVSLGLVIVLSLLALGTMIFLTGGLPWEKKGYTLTAQFDYVGGLKEGDAVRVAGVKVGKVLSISLKGNKVNVVLLLSPEVKLRKGSVFTIGTSGIVGEKYVDIIPGREGEILAPGSKVEGVSPQRIEELIKEIRLSAKRFSRVMDDLEKLIGNREFRTSIKESAVRLKEVLLEARESLAKFKKIESELSQKASRLMDELRMTISENRKGIKSVVQNLRSVTLRLKEFAQRFATPQNAERIEETLASIKKAADEISSLAKGFSEGKLPGNLNKMMSDVKSTIEETKRIVSKVKSMKAQGGARFRYGESSSSRGEEEGFTDIWFRIGFPNERDSVYIGLDDMGGENGFSFLLEKKIKEGLLQRFGVIRGKPGYGIFRQASPRFSWEFDIRDVKNPELDLSLWYRIIYGGNRDVYLFGRLDYQGGELKPSFGIEYRF